jgi:hypothetical protein
MAITFEVLLVLENGVAVMDPGRLAGKLDVNILELYSYMYSGSAHEIIACRPEVGQLVIMVVMISCNRQSEPSKLK